MNVDHLRKQAKNLRKLFPELLASNPTTLPLSASQAVIAKINGYPSWDALVAANRAREEHAPPSKPESGARATKPPRLAPSIAGSFELQVSPVVVRIPTAWGPEGKVARTKKGFNAIFRYRTAKTEKAIGMQNERLFALFDAAIPAGGHVSTLSKEQRADLRLIFMESLSHYPQNIEAQATLAALHLEDDQVVDALSITTPIADTMLAMIPAGEVVHINYSEPANRPFHRLMHTHVLALQAHGYFAQAAHHARRMESLHPADAMGFRLLRSGGQA